MDLWYTRCPVPTASSIAIERGLLEAAYAPEGIRVRSLNASAERAVRGAHFDHSMTGLFRQGGNIPPIWSRSRGADTVVVATSWVDDYQAIVALPESGIRAPLDLRGRRLGLPRRTSDGIDYWRAMCLHGYESALSIAGLGIGDVEIVDLPIDESQIPDGGASERGTLWRGAVRARRQSREAIALMRGEIDAMYTASGPGAQLTAFLGARVVVDIGAHPDRMLRVNNHVPTTLTVDRRLATERPDLVARYLRCLGEAAGWAAAHPVEARRILAEDIGATAEWVAAANGERVHEALALAMDETHLQALELQKRFLLRHGFIDRDFPLMDWIDPTALRLAEPADDAAAAR